MCTRHDALAEISNVLAEAWRAGIPHEQLSTAAIEASARRMVRVATGRRGD